MADGMTPPVDGRPIREDGPLADALADDGNDRIDAGGSTPECLLQLTTTLEGDFDISYNDIAVVKTGTELRVSVSGDLAYSLNLADYTLNISRPATGTGQTASPLNNGAYPNLVKGMIQQVGVLLDWATGDSFTQLRSVQALLTEILNFYPEFIFSDAREERPFRYSDPGSVCLGQVRVNLRNAEGGYVEYRMSLDGVICGDVQRIPLTRFADGWYEAYIPVELVADRFEGETQFRVTAQRCGGQFETTAPFDPESSPEQAWHAIPSASRMDDPYLGPLCDF